MKNSLLRYWTLFVITILCAFFLWYIRGLITPLVIAALFAYVLNPSVDFLVRQTRFSRSLAIMIVFLVGIGLIVAVSTIMFPVLLDEIHTLSSDLNDILVWLQSFLAEPKYILQWEINIKGLVPDPMSLLSNQVTALSGNVFHLIGTTTENFIWTLVILVTTYYLLRDYAKLRDWLFGFVSQPHQPIINRIYLEIKEVWSGYLQGNLTLMAIVGIVFSLAWLAIGLPGALILGIIAGMLTIIPDLGPAIAAALAILVALVEGSNYLPISNFWFALLVLGLYLFLINIKNIFVRPRIYGHSVHMHDGLVFIAIMAAVVLQGILGALIVVPVLATLGIIGKYIYRSMLELPLWSDNDVETENPS